MELLRKSKLPQRLALSGLLIFSFFFCYDLIFLKRYLNHPEYLTYYHGFRIWFLKNLLKGHFPQWNPYWGLGHSTEIEASFPIDIYTLLELIFGFNYHWFQWVQCFLILVSGFWCFQTLGLSTSLAVVGSLSFFLSPWVNYFFFYFIKANSFIGLFISFPLVLKWFQTANKKLLPLIALATIFTMSGTKLDFWFFHFCFFGLFSVVYTWQARLSFSRLYWLAVAIGAGILSQSWQWIWLYQILGASDRIGQHYGLGALKMGEFYYQIVFSIASSIFIKTAVCTLFLYKCIQSKANRARYFWLGLGMITFFVCQLWQTPHLKSLFSTPYGVGLLAGLFIHVLSGQADIKSLLSSLLLFLPLAFYWCRPLPGDINELTILHSAPMGLKIVASCLCYLGCTSALKNSLSKSTYICLIILFLLRDQGQILLSYFFGLVWIPTRDNFIFEFLLALLGVSGISVFKNYDKYALVFILILILSPISNYYYSHPLIEKVSEPYPLYEGDSELSSFLLWGKKERTDRVYFLGKKYSGELSMYASSILTETNQVHMFSSFMPKNYHDWSTYQWFGFRPEDQWSSYEGEYTDETISKLPFRDTKGIHTNHVYWYALHASPTPNLDTLKFLGVNRIISEAPIPKSPFFSNFFQKGKYYTARLEDSLPKAFALPLTENSKKLIRLELQVPEIRGKTLKLNSFETSYIPVLVQSYENERILLQTTGDVPSQIVLTELQHPFWHARVDGREVPTEPAFSIFRSIEVPKGKHSIEFYCKIPFLKFAFILSVVSFGGILCWLILLNFSGVLNLKLLAVLLGLDVKLRLNLKSKMSKVVLFFARR